MVIKDIVAVVGLSAVPLFCLKALAVTRFDFDAASSLITSTPVAMFVSAMLLGFAPILFSFIGIYLFILQQNYMPFARKSRKSLILGSLAYLGCLVFFLPLALVAEVPEAISFAFAPLLVGWMMSMRMPLVLLLAFEAAFIALLMSLGADMWLPPENIRTNSGQLTGYVLSVADRDIVIYRADRRSVERVPKDSVRERQFCDPNHGETLASAVLGKPTGRPICFSK